MEQDTSSQKIKRTRLTIISVSIIVVFISVLLAIAIIGFVRSLSGAPTKEKFSKYNQKIYSVTSDDEILQGFIAYKIVSCGEFPSDICLNTYYNFLLKEPLNISEGEMTFSDYIGTFGYLEPVYCDVDISKINLFERYVSTLPFSCENSSSRSSVKSYFVSSIKVIGAGEPLHDISNTGTVSIYDLSESNRSLIKTYQVKIQPTN